MGELAIRAPVVADAPRLAALLNAHAVAVEGEESTTEDEVRSWFSLPGLQPEHDMRVAVAPDGDLVGYADIAGQETGPLHVDLRVPPDDAWATPALLDAMEARAAERGSPPRALRVHGSSSDDAVVALLRARGYAVVRSSFRMETSVGAEPAAPAWPSGIKVRASRGPDDLPAIHAAAEEAFADHWGYEPLAFEEWCRWNVRDTLDPSLWFLAEDGGEVAGISLCRLDETPDRTLGWVSILGVRRAWRGRGLARALLLHSFDALRLRGCTRVGLGVDSQNTTGAVRLYESVGMRVAHRGDSWERGAA